MDDEIAVTAQQETSESKPKGTAKLSLKLEVYAPCPCHAPNSCNCPKKPVETRELPDLFTKQFAQLVLLNILNSNQTIKDTGGSNNSETANTSSGTVTILAGTSSTAATVTDNALGTQTETVAGTVGTYSGSGSSGSFAVTGTITATSARAYVEMGLRVTVNAHTYLIARDTFSTLNVSNGGTLAVTYTFTFS